MVMVVQYVWAAQSVGNRRCEEALMGDLPTAKDYSGVHTNARRGT